MNLPSYWKSPVLYDRVYIGISHGACSMMSFLSNVHELGVEQEACKRVLKKAVNFVVKQYRKSPHPGLFPNMIGDKIEPMQFALCYGDIGNAYALYRASQILEEDRLKTFTNMVLTDCLGRTKKDNMTLDAGIFYGAAGLVIAFDKLAKLTGDQLLADRAKYWYDLIPSYCVHENEYAGFKSRLDESRLWNYSYGWGIIGVGTTLMAYGDNKLPSLAPLSFIA